MRIFALLLIGLTGCANVSSTRFEYTDGANGKVSVEFPKELTATNLAVTIDAKAGTATIKADAIKTVNLEAIKAQLNAAKDVSAAITKAGIEAAVSSATGGIAP